MIDTLLRLLPEARKRRARQRLGLGKRYAVLTLHRPSNVDKKDSLTDMISAVGQVAETLPVAFPCHPRTRLALTDHGIEIPKTIRIIDPLGYLDFLNLVAGSSLVLTDSGGLQEETSILGIPCLTLRTTTERPITVSLGTNVVVGTDPNDIIKGFRLALGRPRRPAQIPLWDGKTGPRIADVLLEAS